MRTEKGTVIKKSTKYGVGKQVGNTIYLHKSVEDKLPSEVLVLAKDKLPTNFDYTIVVIKLDARDQTRGSTGL